MTYAGEVTYGDISVSRSHCRSHTVVQEKKCHFLRREKHELALLVMYTESEC